MQKKTIALFQELNWNPSESVLFSGEFQLLNIETHIIRADDWILRKGYYWI